MTTQPSAPDGIKRVFIGIPVDEVARLSISEMLKPLKSKIHNTRWVSGNSWHFTLAFLGDKPSSEVDYLLQLAEKAYKEQKRFQYRLSAISRFPDPAGRIIALVGHPVAPLYDLFQITCDLLQSNRIDFDHKAFRPHITLGRIRKPTKEKITIEQATDIKIDINKVVIYQSSLSASGSIYSSLREIHLN